MKFVSVAFLSILFYVVAVHSVHAAPSSIKNDDSIDDVRKSVKCFGDVFDELVGKENKLYKLRLHINNINRLLDRYEKITLPDLKKRCTSDAKFVFAFSRRILMNELKEENQELAEKVANSIKLKCGLN